MDVTYFYKYSDVDGVTAVSDNTFVDPIDAYEAAQRSEGSIYKRVEEPFDIEEFKKKLFEERDQLQAKINRFK